MNKHKILRTIVFVLIGAGLGLVWKAYNAPDASSSNKKSAIMAPGFNPEFSLLNHDGKTVTAENYNDKYQLVYFGFTFCPEICPTELQKMANILKILGDKSSQIHPLFISVDPTRDTPEVMKEYLKSFGSEFIGLTGTEEDVDKAMASFKVYAAKTDDPAYVDYMMAHSSYLYFLNKDGDLLGLYRKEETAEKIADDIKSNL